MWRAEHSPRREPAQRAELPRRACRIAKFRILISSSGDDDLRHVGRVISVVHLVGHGRIRAPPSVLVSRQRIVRLSDVVIETGLGAAGLEDNNPNIDKILTTRPLPCFRMCGSTALVIRITPKTLMSKSHCDWAIEFPSLAPLRPMPALLINTSIRPNSEITASTAPGQPPSCSVRPAPSPTPFSPSRMHRPRRSPRRLCSPVHRLSSIRCSLPLWGQSSSSQPLWGSRSVSGLTRDSSPEKVPVLPDSGGRCSADGLQRVEGVVHGLRSSALG